MQGSVSNLRIRHGSSAIAERNDGEVQPCAERSPKPSSSTTVLDSSGTAFLRRTYLHLLGAIVALVVVRGLPLLLGLALRVAQAILGTNWLIILGGFAIATWLARSVAQQSELDRGPVPGPRRLHRRLGDPARARPPRRAAQGGRRRHPDGSGHHAGRLLGADRASCIFSKKDFSFLRSVVRWGGFCALGLIVASVLFGFNLGTFFTVAMIALAGASILLDTHNVLNHYPRRPARRGGDAAVRVNRPAVLVHPAAVLVAGLTPRSRSRPAAGARTSSTWRRSRGPSGILRQRRLEAPGVVRRRRAGLAPAPRRRLPAGGARPSPGRPGRAPRPRSRWPAR